MGELLPRLNVRMQVDAICPYLRGGDGVSHSPPGTIRWMVSCRDRKGRPVMPRQFARRRHAPHYDPFEILTIAVGVVLIVTLAMSF